MTNDKQQQKNEKKWGKIAFYSPKKVIFTTMLSIGICTALVVGTPKVVHVIGKTLKNFFEEGYNFEKWSRNDLADYISDSAAVKSKSPGQIARIQSTINTSIIENGGSEKDLIVVDGQYGRETDSAIRSSRYLSKQDIIHRIIETDMLITDDEYQENLQQELQKYIEEENKREAEESRRAFQKLLASEQTTSFELPTSEQIREADANEVREALYKRWLKNKDVYNSEVEDFQKTVNNIFGKTVLDVDGKLGWRTQKMLLETLTIEQIEQLERKNSVIFNIMHREYIKTHIDSQAAANAEQVRETLRKRWSPNAKKYNPEVLEFQKAVNVYFEQPVLDVDGFFGPKTQKRLNDLTIPQMNLIEYDNAFIQKIIKEEEENEKKQKLLLQKASSKETQPPNNQKPTKPVEIKTPVLPEMPKPATPEQKKEEQPSTPEKRHREFIRPGMYDPTLEEPTSIVKHAQQLPQDINEAQRQ